MDAAARIAQAVSALPRGEPLLLAVSGGLDSMVLLDTALRVLPPSSLRVATFDHGTGMAATHAAALVDRVARAHGIPVTVGGGQPLPRTEAAWRDARWAFLRSMARKWDARIVTAHTADDQAETVLMRGLRGAGARGLAGLLAGSDVLRPLLPFTRAELACHAASRGIEFFEDPSNQDRRFLRNRVRHDLLPALERVRPEFRKTMLEVGNRAAEWRREMDAVAAECCPSRPTPGGGLLVAVSGLRGYDAASLAVLWPAIAARAGLALDHRGTRRLAEFTIVGGPGAVMPLSGAWVVVRGEDAFELRRTRPAVPKPSPLPLSGALRWGRWCFYIGEVEADGPWGAILPGGLPLTVRSWEPTDRLHVGTGLVRVKRLLAEAGIGAADRAGWPVVVSGDAIVWIPGVSRARAATARSGRPGVSIRCEPSDG